MHDASQQLEMEGNQTGSTSKNPIYHTLQETFTYPLRLLFANPQAVLYEGFKFKHDKTLTEKLSAPFEPHKVDEPLKDVNLLKKRGKGERTNKQEEGGGDDNDNYDDILLTYLLVVRSCWFHPLYISEKMDL